MTDFLRQLHEIKNNRPQVYKIITLDLSTARSDYAQSIAGNYFIVLEATDINANVQVRFNESYCDAATLKKRQGFKIPFYRVFITNAVQAGKTLTIAYGVNESPLEFIDQSAAIDVTSIAHLESNAPALYNVSCAVAGTEYSQALPANTKKFTVKARGGSLKVCFTSTESGTKYILLPDGSSMSEDLVYLAAQTLYFQSPTTGAVAEIIAYT
ncbi:MAG: hypothetical protein HY884_05425 [Deltaproteobacteria bacterium]|nr:hypothetical protein [Deltaproteobacteria bacterium]